MDWYKAKTGTNYDGKSDPGVISVTKIYSYYKKFGYKTIVMGASFRNTDEILNLAGCDRLTIAPSLLESLSSSYDEVSCFLSPKMAESGYPGDKVATDEPSFRLALNDDAMATEKLAEGIRNFITDIVKLEGIISSKIESHKKK